MPNECSKAIARRLFNSAFATKYFVGEGIDIGAGTSRYDNTDSLEKYKQQFPLMKSCRGWDVEDGDANFMNEVADNSYDFVHSSHCLEHMVNPYQALANWIRIVKPGGYLVITIPDEDLYEQGGEVKDGRFYSNFNGDHKFTFTIYKDESWSPQSMNLTDVIKHVAKLYSIKIIKLELIDINYQYDVPRYDQTGGIAECAIELILQKL